jgi:FlaA1/EpsC-like NDP-sugar epimerase
MHRTSLRYLPVVLALWFAASWANGLYAPQRRLSRTDELFSVARAGSVATLLLVSLTFFYREYTFSRVMLLLFWFASILLASSGRALIVIAVRARRRRGYNLSPALIVGAGELGRRSPGKSPRCPSSACVAGFVDDLPPARWGAPASRGLDDLPRSCAPTGSRCLLRAAAGGHLQLERGRR